MNQKLQNIKEIIQQSKKLDVESVLCALEKTGSNKAKAARLLGVGRATLYRFLNQHPDAIFHPPEEI